MNYKKLAGAGIAAIGLILFSVLDLPLFSVLGETRDQVESQQAALDEKKNIFEKVAQLKKQVNSKKSSIEQLTAVLPSSKKPQEIVVNVEEASKEAGLNLTDLKTAELITTDKTAGFETMQVELGGTGSYQSAVELFRLLEKNLRVFDVQNFTITQDSSGDLNRMHIDIKLYTYYIKNQSE